MSWAQSHVARESSKWLSSIIEIAHKCLERLVSRNATLTNYYSYTQNVTLWFSSVILTNLIHFFHVNSYQGTDYRAENRPDLHQNFAIDQCNLRRFIMETIVINMIYACNNNPKGDVQLSRLISEYSRDTLDVIISLNNCSYYLIVSSIYVSGISI